MLAKKVFASLAVLVAGAALSAPAFADRGHRHGQRVAVHQPHYVVQHRPRHVVHHAPVVVHRAPIVHHVYHRPAPRPVIVVERHHHVNPVAVLAGAVIGAAIVHHVVTGY